MKCAGSGTDPSSLGRGVTRGARENPPDILRTRPKDLESKKGQSGQPVNLATNYFALKMKTDWKLYQYA